MNEELEIILIRLEDEGWVEKSFVYFDGIHEVRLQKGNKILKLELCGE